MVFGPRLFYFGKIKRFVWNGVGIGGWGRSLDFDLKSPNEMNIPYSGSWTSTMIMLINEMSKINSLQKPRGFIPKFCQKSKKSKFLKSLKNVLESGIGSDSI